jgi:hypothetical protein
MYDLLPWPHPLFGISTELYPASDLLSPPILGWGHVELSIVCSCSLFLRCSPFPLLCLIPFVSPALRPLLILHDSHAGPFSDGPLRPLSPPITF